MAVAAAASEQSYSTVTTSMNFYHLKHHFLTTLFHYLKIACFLLLTLSINLLFFRFYGWNPISCSFPWLSTFLFLILQTIISSSSPQVFMVDFSCFKPPRFCRVPISAFIENASLLNCFDDESIGFMAKIIESSGQGEQTSLPPPLHYIPPRTTQQDSINEAQMVLFPVMDDLLSKTKISPKEIDIIIVNCSGFCPSPSLSSIIVNKYSLRADVKSFNVSGMGCSASAIAIDMACKLLKVHSNSNAVVLSTEVLSTGWYAGKEKAKLVLNCLFRMGGAAILVTNRREFKTTAKYRLLGTVRTQRIFDDKAYFSAIREEDSEGITGVTLKRDLLQVAQVALRSHVTILGTRILPLKEKLQYTASLLRKNLENDDDDYNYVPDFTSVIQHFCVPGSGKAIIRKIRKGLKVKEEEVEAALATLHRFGNQSSSSMWYQLGYVEGKGKVKKGDKVWQLGMGSGPKCCSLVWKCMETRAGEEKGKKGAWQDCIDRYPECCFG